MSHDRPVVPDVAAILRRLERRITPIAYAEYMTAGRRPRVATVVLPVPEVRGEVVAGYAETALGVLGDAWARHRDPVLDEPVRPHSFVYDVATWIDDALAVLGVEDPALARRARLADEAGSLGCTVEELIAAAAVAEAYGLDDEATRALDDLAQSLSVPRLDDDATLETMTSALASLARELLVDPADRPVARVACRIAAGITERLDGAGEWFADVATTLPALARACAALGIDPDADPEGVDLVVRVAVHSGLARTAGAAPRVAALVGPPGHPGPTARRTILASLLETWGCSFDELAATVDSVVASSTP